MILRNANIYYRGELISGAILIQDGIIKSIYKQSNNDDFEPFKKKNNDGIEIDCEKRFILPGIIDIHSHLRDMGQSNKETFRTGTLAAAYSGITTVFAMPNTKPPAINAKQIKKWKKKAKYNIFINVGFISGVPKCIDEVEIKKILAQGVIGFKIYPLKSLNGVDWTISENIQKLLQVSSKYQVPIFIHPDWPLEPEEEKKLKKKNSKLPYLKYYNKLHSESNEAKYVDFILEQYLKIIETSNSLSNTPIVHFCHISCKESFDKIQQFLEKNEKIHSLNISLEVTPHHLLLSNDINLENENIGKVLPPLRDKTQNSYLFDQFKEGKITLMGTDHAPHTIHEKSLNHDDAPSGFPGFETYSLLLLNKVFMNELSLDTFLKVSSENPAKRFNLKQKGFIEKGNDADIIIVEKVGKFSINSKNFKTKAKFTPFENSNLSDRESQVLIWKVFLKGFEINTESAGPKGKIIKKEYIKA
jgi:dihydroorotase